VRAFVVDLVLRTNDLILISVVESLLAAERLRFFVADAHMSALEGSTGFLPRRVLVHPDDAPRARRILREAGYGDELHHEPRGG
jgi:Putative prokaryotic signal transducing protein